MSFVCLFSEKAAARFIKGCAAWHGVVYSACESLFAALICIRLSSVVSFKSSVKLLVSIFESTASCWPVAGIFSPFLPAAWGEVLVGCLKCRWNNLHRQDVLVSRRLGTVCGWNITVHFPQAAPCELWKFHHNILPHARIHKVRVRWWEKKTTFCGTLFSHTVCYVTRTGQSRIPICFVRVLARNEKCWAATADLIKSIYLARLRSDIWWADKKEQWGRHCRARDVRGRMIIGGLGSYWREIPAGHEAQACESRCRRAAGVGARLWTKSL